MLCFMMEMLHSKPRAGGASRKGREKEGSFGNPPFPFNGPLLIRSVEKEDPSVPRGPQKDPIINICHAFLFGAVLKTFLYVIWPIVGPFFYYMSVPLYIVYRINRNPAVSSCSCLYLLRKYSKNMARFTERLSLIRVLYF